jgi:catechol 2,3-dioxygenase-like lactoylglutathione lyase family enzyme
MARGHMHHLDLTVQDLERSTPFYASLLGFMGYRKSKAGDGWIDWQLPAADGCPCSIAIRQARHKRAHDRYAAGLHHFAWAAASRDDVDRLHAHLKTMGATILDAAADYSQSRPQYRAGHYAVFFADPDGLKLEYAYTPADPAD